MKELEKEKDTSVIALNSENQSIFDKTTDVDSTNTDTYLFIPQQNEQISQAATRLVSRTGDKNFQNVSVLQRSDPYFGPIVAYLSENALPESQKDARKVIVAAADFFVVDDTLYHSRQPKSVRAQNMSKAQLALPESMIKSVLRMYHESSMGAHCGIQSMLDLIREHYFFPKMSTIISEYVRSCPDCQSRKVVNSKTKKFKHKIKR